MTHICVSKLTIIGSDNGLSPGRRQAIIWTNAGILLIGILWTSFSEIHTFSYKKMHLKMSVIWQAFCLSLGALSVKEIIHSALYRINTIRHEQNGLRLFSTDNFFSYCFIRVNLKINTNTFLHWLRSGIQLFCLQKSSNSFCWNKNNPIKV